MKISRLELSTGAFVVAGLLAIGYLVVQAEGDALFGPDTYTISARFANSGGLTEGSSVVIAGVPVGRVHRVTLNSSFAALVELRLHRNIQLPTDTTASVRTAGLIGDKFVSLVPGSDTELISPGGTIIGTESAIDLESLISRFAFGSVETEAGTPARRTASASDQAARSLGLRLNCLSGPAHSLQDHCEPGVDFIGLQPGR
jgi:phospholipid/cholesterol/gamma-HCH transport system substrate-binding protein